MLVFLMSFEIELHAVPHLKRLINGKNKSGRQECVGIFMYRPGQPNLDFQKMNVLAM